MLVHLGDYIDQGPDSAGVVDLLAAGPLVSEMSVVNLLGDHERMLLDGLGGDRAAATDWLWAGGREALASWGAAGGSAARRLGGGVAGRSCRMAAQPGR